MMEQTNVVLMIVNYSADKLLKNCTLLEKWLDDPDVTCTDGSLRCRMMLHEVDELRIHLSLFNEEKMKSELPDEIVETIVFYIEDLTDRICKLTNRIDKIIEIVNDQTTESLCRELKQSIKEFQTKIADFKEEK